MTQLIKTHFRGMGSTIEACIKSCQKPRTYNERFICFEEGTISIYNKRYEPLFVNIKYSLHITPGETLYIIKKFGLYAAYSLTDETFTGETEDIQWA